MKAMKVGSVLILCFTACTPVPTPSTFTHILVTNASNMPVAGAEVFQDGELKGVTDSAGKFVFTPALPSGAKLFARSLVYTHPSYRPNTAGGYVMHVYQTSLVVNNDGSVTDFTVTSPKATQTLTVSPNNALIGWHLTVNLDWDASGDEFNELKIRFEEASDYLYNLTDGQFFIEQVDIADDGQFYLAAEIQFKVDNFAWPKTTHPGGFLAAVGGLPHVYMAPFGDQASTNDARTLIHELGHLAFGLQDEYSGPFSQGCTTIRRNPTPTTPANFKNGGDRAACFMDAQIQTSKMCAVHANAAHANGSWQPGPCWDAVIGAYSDPGGTGRWVLKTPDTRVAVPGTLPVLPVGLKPKFIPNNKLYSDLCKPVAVADSNGAAAYKGAVWVRPKSWRKFDYSVGALDVNGKLLVRGVHAGDLIKSPFQMLIAPCVITQ